MIDLDKFLKDLSSAKLFTIGLVVNGLFWYLNIYLFGKHIIITEQVQIPIIISLCLGFLWYTLSLMIISLLPELEKPKKDRKIIINDKVLQGNIFVSTIISALFTCLVKLIIYFQEPLDAVQANQFFNFTTFTFISFGIFLAIQLVLFFYFNYINIPKKAGNEREPEGSTKQP